ncbi:MAG TPA: hypothetical protein VER03_15795 [Bryobacteraceae bacterium]|nr:hypothetical protein [Bryobacteraceae bacterium]
MKMSRFRWLLVCPLMITMMLTMMLTMLASAQDARTEQPASSDTAVPSGPALGEGEVIILLQARVPLEVIQKFVSTRGVNFMSTKETSKRILAAGGNVALVGTINLNQKDEFIVQPASDDKKKR